MGAAEGLRDEIGGFPTRGIPLAAASEQAKMKRGYFSSGSMNMSRTRNILFVLGTVMAVSVGALRANADDKNDILKGLTRVAVFVGVNDAIKEVEPRLRDQIQTDVELRLRKIGIKVLTHEELLKDDATVPSIIVSLDGIKGKEVPQLLTFLYAVSLWEDVVVTRSRSIVRAATWDKHYFGTIGLARIQDARGNIGDAVDEFCNAYLAANQK